MKANLNRLLVLDDNPQVLAMVCRIGERLGFSASAASSLRDFRTRYVAERPTAIILDVVLNDVDCTGALEFLAACRNEAPIVLMTGHTAGFLDVIQNQAAKFGQRIAGCVEKRRTLYQLEDLLTSIRIPDVELEPAAAGSSSEAKARPQPRAEPASAGELTGKKA